MTSRPETQHFILEQKEKSVQIFRTHYNTVFYRLISGLCISIQFKQMSEFLLQPSTCFRGNFLLYISSDLVKLQNSSCKHVFSIRVEYSLDPDQMTLS